MVRKNIRWGRAVSYIGYIYMSLRDYFLARITADFKMSGGRESKHYS